jgi:hypothetical protein
MTRDLADTVKALSEKAARAIMGKGSPWPKYEQEMVEAIAAVFEPAIRDLIAQNLLAKITSCARRTLVTRDLADTVKALFSDDGNFVEQSKERALQVVEHLNLECKWPDARFRWLADQFQAVLLNQRERIEPAIRDLIAQAVKDEMEACAKLCEAASLESEMRELSLAERIRSRGGKS